MPSDLAILMNVLVCSARTWDVCGDAEWRRIPVERLAIAARDRLARCDVEAGLEIVVRSLGGHRDGSEFVLPGTALDRIAV